MLEIYDCTLREGMQAEGVSFSLSDKLAVIKALDSLGVAYIEAGTPGSNPKDEELFRKLRDVHLPGPLFLRFFFLLISFIIKSSPGHCKANKRICPNL